MFYINDERKIVITYSESDQFGTCTKSQIIDALNNFDSFISPSLDGYSFYVTGEVWLSKALEHIKGRTPDFIYEL